MDEPRIEINGKLLTPAQAMTVRVACTGFHTEMHDPDALGPDEHGRRMVSAYRDRMTEVLLLMLDDTKAAEEPQWEWKG